MKLLMHILVIAFLSIPISGFTTEQKTPEQIQADLDATAKRVNEIEIAKKDAQDLVDQHITGGAKGIPEGHQVIVTDKIKTKITPDGKVTQKLSQKTEVIDITPPLPHPTYNPNVIRLGCTDGDSRDCKLMAHQLKAQLGDMYKVLIIPQKSSVINLAGIRDNQLDWAIVNADAILFHDKLELDVIAKMPPKYAHIVLARMNNDDICDLDDLDGNDLMAIGEDQDDSWTTWRILQNTFQKYLEIPTVKHGGFRALSSTRMQLTQGFFRVDDKQNKIIMRANNEENLKMINIEDNEGIYNIKVRGYNVYNKVYFGDNMYNNLITGGWNPQVSTMEVVALLVSSTKWFSDNAVKYDSMYPRIEMAISNAKRGVRAN